jgi:hypothetical protein
MSVPVAVVVELYYSAGWHDITSYVYMRDKIGLTRGTPNESTTADPSTCTMTWNNRDGRFSQRNPTSPLYGLIGRNTPVRVKVNGNIRFSGEVSALPQAWDTTGTDVYVQIQAAGVLRRLGQGQLTHRFGLPYFITLSHPAFYATCTTNQTIIGGSVGHWIYGSIFGLDHCAANVHFGTGDLGPNLPKGMAVDTTNRVIDGNGYVLSGRITGAVNIPTAATAVGVFFVFRCDQLGPMTLYVVDNAYPFQKEWDVDLRADGTNNDIRMTIREGDPENGPTVTVLDTTAANVLDSVIADGLPHTLMVTLTESGANVNWVIYLDGVSVLSGTRNSRTVDGLFFVALTYQPLAASRPVAVGQLTAWQDANIPAAANLSADGSLYSGETAADRVSRLCGENNIAFTLVGTAADTTRMGAQGAGNLVSLLQECAAADLGILYEPRDSLGLKYRTRTDLYVFGTSLNLDYSTFVFGAPPNPTDDDQNIHNDVTVTGAGGTAEAILATGPLSILAPPDGINTYPTSYSVNTETAGPLSDLAAWLLHLGTIDEARYPTVMLNMLTPAIVGNGSLITSIVASDVGSVIVLTDLPAWLPPDDVALTVRGYAETIDQFTWDITFNCLPRSPYAVAIYGSAALRDGSRFDAENSTLASNATSGATSLSVASAAGTQLWTTVAGEFPFDVKIGGERITVTNITGASSPQTFTVTRSVNGIVKAHASGEQVQLWFTPRFAL